MSGDKTSNGYIIKRVNGQGWEAFWGGDFWQSYREYAKVYTSIAYAKSAAKKIKRKAASDVLEVVVK